MEASCQISLFKDSNHCNCFVLQADCTSFPGLRARRISVKKWMIIDKHTTKLEIYQSIYQCYSGQCCLLVQRATLVLVCCNYLIPYTGTSHFMLVHFKCFHIYAGSKIPRKIYNLSMFLFTCM